MVLAMETKSVRIAGHPEFPGKASAEH